MRTCIHLYIHTHRFAKDGNYLSCIIPIFYFRVATYLDGYDFFFGAKW
jgi:hypothetical protein